MTTVLSPVTNDAKSAIAELIPYNVRIRIEGIAPLLFHRWSVEGVEVKAKAAKGSRAKKEDDLETYVYRNTEGELCVPSEYVRMSLVNAAKFKQDPRSPRKSAMELVKAGIICLDELCSTGLKSWDFVDRRRVMIQRNAITRSRPALFTGWQIAIALRVVLPQYLDSQLVNELAQSAGMLCGVGDFRPTYGRFQILQFELIKLN